jgi:diguanylate cyclase (GGDEF)-like protein
MNKNNEGEQAGDGDLAPTEETAALRAEIARLRREVDDLQAALENTCEHGDLIEAELAEANGRLKLEVVERQRAEDTLRVLLETVTQQKSDLEILMQILAEHGDQIDQQWTEKVDEVRLLTALDPLTRIGNRRGLDEYYAHQWQLVTEAHGQLSLILCDIDHFKLYNDYYGHQAGDQCLIRVARAMDETVDKAAGFVARNGGEEFAVVLPGLDTAAALIIAETMRARVAALEIPHVDSATAPVVTISLGVASLAPQTGDAPESLFHEADRLLYQAKHDGRNRVAY